jgi:uncharacterized protein (TIGR03437 family)
VLEFQTLKCVNIRGFHMIRHIAVLLALVAVAFGQTAPTITNITNAAIPTLDSPPASIHLAPQSMATIFGSNLADFATSASSPWPSSLAGTEVHLAVDTCFDSSCDLIAPIIYASPAQINFLVPDNGSFACHSCTPVAYRVVLVRGGQRIDNRSYISGGPGRLIIDPYYIADYSVVFHVGYDCLFSYSQSDSGSCGLSWSSGQHRAPVGAITDSLTGQLISSQSPIHQGQVITLWMTALAGGVKLNTATGLLEQANPAPVNLGVAQNGKDIPSTIAMGMEGEYGQFQTQAPLWAGESPQFIGLDQVNVAFPTCKNVTNAAVEKRYDAFLTYTSVETSNTVRIYMPFIVRVGDPDCQWTTNTTTTLTSSNNPSPSGQAVKFTAAVSPSPATGTVTFLDGSTVLGSGVVTGGTATLTTAALSVGDHSIIATYSGDANYRGSSSTRTQTVTKAITTTSVSSSVNPSASGQAVTLFAGVYTPEVSSSPGISFVRYASGNVTFFDGGTNIGSATLVPGIKPVTTASASISTSGLGIGSHSITAKYDGDATNSGSTSAVLTQVVTSAKFSIAITYSPSAIVFGQVVAFTVTPSNPAATGTVTLFDGTATIGTAKFTNGQATFSTSTLSGGNHTITANYSGDSTFASTFTSITLTVTVNKTPTVTVITSKTNPTTYQPPANTCTPPSPSCQVYPTYATLTATVTPSFPGSKLGLTASFYATTTNGGSNTMIQCNRGQPVYINQGVATCTVTGNLSTGTSTITAVSSGDETYLGSTSLPITQVVNMPVYNYPNPAVAGQTVTLTVVTGWPWSSGGVVTFSDGNTVIGSGIVSPVNNQFSSLNGSNTATFQTASLGVGSHSITAVYTPTPGVTVATSQAVTQTVTAH